MKSVAVVMDYQNVHMTSADVFRPNQPKENSLISPYKFGMQLIAARKESLAESSIHVEYTNPLAFSSHLVTI